MPVPPLVRRVPTVLVPTVAVRSVLQPTVLERTVAVRSVREPTVLERTVLVVTGGRPEKLGHQWQ